MLQFIQSMYQPYAKVISLAGKLSALAVTGYGTRQIWTKDNEGRNSAYVKSMLSVTYLTHMSAMALTAAVLMGSVDVSPAIAASLVGLTALAKSRAELGSENDCRDRLKKKQIEIERQLHINHVDGDRVTLIAEALIDGEYELQVQEDTLSALQQQIGRFRRFGKSDHTETRAQLKSIATEAKTQLQKTSMLTRYFAEYHPDTIDIDNIYQKLAGRAKTLQLKLTQARAHKATSEIEALETELNSVGTISFHCIKIKKVLLKIKQCEAQKQDDPYLDNLIVELKVKLSSMMRMDTTEATNNFGFLMDTDIDTISNEQTLFLKRRVIDKLQKEYDLLQQKYRVARLKYQDKRANFAYYADHSLNDESRRLIGELLDTQNALLIAEYDAQSKTSNLTFTTATSGIAILLGLIPNNSLTYVLQPTMLTVGVIAGLSSTWDFYNRYDLKQKISDEKGRKLLRLEHDKGINVIAKREALIKSLKDMLATKASQPTSRNAKITASAKILNQYQSKRRTIKCSSNGLERTHKLKM